MDNPNPCEGLNSVCLFKIQNSTKGKRQTNSRFDDLKCIMVKKSDDSIAMKTNQELEKKTLSIENTGDANEKGNQILAPKLSFQVTTDSNMAYVSGSEFVDGNLPYNGTIIVNLGKEFFDSAHSIWKNSCIGFTSDKISSSFEDFHKSVINNLKCVGVTNVIRHNLGFLVLRFDTNENLITATELGTLRVDGVDDPFEIFVKPWDEKLLMSSVSHETVNMWIQFSNVPFTYWSKEGLFRLASVVGKPVRFDEITMKAVHDCSPAFHATILVEISTMNFLPNVIIACLDENASAVARVQVLYLNTLEPCKVCHKFSHDTMNCRHLVDSLNTEKLYANREKFGWYFKFTSQIGEKDNDVTNVNLIQTKSYETDAILGNHKLGKINHNAGNVESPFSLSNTTRGKKKKFKDINVNDLDIGGTSVDAGVGVIIATNSGGMGINIGMVAESDEGSLLMQRKRGRPRGSGRGRNCSRGRGGNCFPSSSSALSVPSMRGRPRGRPRGSGRGSVRGGGSLSPSSTALSEPKMRGRPRGRPRASGRGCFPPSSGRQ
ncbi:hypothetical protein AgCh_014602 [Apium graveolens]